MLSSLATACAGPTILAPSAMPILQQPVEYSYVERVMNAISTSTVYGGVIPAGDNPAVTVLIELLPDGRVESVNLRKTSGYPNFDESVRQGILRASPLPKKNDGTVERRIEVRFFMKRVAAR